MARIRSIKPAAFMSERVDEYAGDMFRTFVGLWCYCDDKGRGRDDEDLVKAEVWPRVKRMTAAKVRSHIDTFAGPDDGPLCRYEVDGKPYFHFVNWTEHQKINRPTPSKLPPCSTHEDEVSPHVPLTEDSVSPHARKGREGKGVGREVGGDESSQSQTDPTALDDDGLDRVMKLTNGTEAHARKTAIEILTRAPADVRDRVAYVVKAIQAEPDLYRQPRGNPRRGEDCPTHIGQWADACAGCAADRKAAS